MATPGGVVVPAERFWAVLGSCGAAAQARYLQQSALRLNPEQARSVAASIAGALAAPAVDEQAAVVAGEALAAVLGQGPSGPLSGEQGPSGPLSGAPGPSGPLSGAPGPSGPLSGPRLVCRSSSAMEDGRVAAFPGVFTSVLGIASADGLAAAVAACWRSVFSPAAVGYLLRMGVEPVDFSLALLVQRQVDAPWFGVYASLDPVTGASGPVASVSSAGPEAVVGGAPATFHAVRRGGHWAGAGHLAPALDAVHEAAQRLGAHLGTEVDVEFALAGTGPVILQCRPLTAVGEVLARPPTGAAPAGRPCAAGRAPAGRPCAAGRAAGLAGAPGGIAVVERLTPADVAVVLTAAGVVTEQDASPLGHAAILCRELGVPLICGVAGAGARFAGRWLSIDGATGQIEVAPPPPEGQPGPERPPEREAGPERPPEREAGPERPPERGAGPTNGTVVAPAEVSVAAPGPPALSTVELLLRVLAEGRPGHPPVDEAQRIRGEYARALGAQRSRLVAHDLDAGELGQLDRLGAGLFGPAFSAAALLAALAGESGGGGEAGAAGG